MSRPKRGDVMKHITPARTALVIIAVAAGVLAATAAARTDTTAAAKPIVIGAVVDTTKNMAPFDAPALLAAQLEIKAINKKGGVNGRPLKLISLNDQLDLVDVGGELEVVVQRARRTVAVVRLAGRDELAVELLVAVLHGPLREQHRPVALARVPRRADQAQEP